MRAAVPLAHHLLITLIACGFFIGSGDPAAGQDLVPPASDLPAPTPDAQRELNALLSLALPQQKERARKLIEAYPGTELAAILRRLLDESAAFDQLAEDEQAAREARAAWGRLYWRDRCCPLPAWNPPVGRIVNETTEPVLYQQRIEGIYHTRWSGPYRLRADAGHESPHPFLVRYLSGGAMQVRVIAPGDSYAFRGSPADGTLELVPTTIMAPGMTLPLPTEPTPDPAPSEASRFDGPMILR